MSFIYPEKLKSGVIAITITFALAGCLISDYFFQSAFKHPEKSLWIQYSDDQVHFKKEGKLVEAEKSGQPDVVTIGNKERIFHHNPDLLVLCILTLITMAMASGAFPLFIGQALQLKKIFRLKNLQIWYAIAGSFGLILFLYLLQVNMPGRFSPDEIIAQFHILFKDGKEQMLNQFLGAALLLQIPLFTVIFLIGPSSDHISSITNFKKENIVKATFQLRLLNRILRNAFWVLSVGIVFSVLTSSALESAIKSDLTIHDFDIHPKKMCFVLGLFFSLFIGAIYIPVFLYLKSRTIQFKEILLDNQHLLTDEDESIAQRMVNTMENKNSVLETMEMVISILAPVAAGLFSQQ